MILTPLWRCCFSHAVFINLLVVQIQLAEDYTLLRNVSLKIMPKKGVFMLVALGTVHVSEMLLEFWFLLPFLAMLCSFMGFLLVSY